MSKPQPDLIRQQQLRRRWLIALRSEGHRKCRGLCLCVEMKGKRTQFVCALALLGELVYGHQWWQKVPREDEYSIGRLAGLSDLQVAELIHRNDGGICSTTNEYFRPHSFGEIADIICGWFPADHEHCSGGGKSQTRVNRHATSRRQPLVSGDGVATLTNAITPARRK